MVEVEQDSNKTYQLYWMNGTCEQAEGKGLAHAFHKAGYSGGAMRALDFYEQSDHQGWRYDQVRKTWVQKELASVRMKLLRALL